jgi:hypothetical protein
MLGATGATNQGLTASRFFSKITDASRRRLVAALNEWNDKAHTLACDELSARFARAFKGCFDDLRESAVVS